MASWREMGVHNRASLSGLQPLKAASAVPNIHMRVLCAQTAMVWLAQ